MNVRFLELAQKELDDAFAWYEAQVRGLGMEFLDEIDRAVRRITSWPLSSQELSPGIRRCIVSRFPYGLVYVQEPDTVIVLAVAHLHRRPRYWIDRADAP
jgi:plasmid stabilization system protein ParE